MVDFRTRLVSSEVTEEEKNDIRAEAIEEIDSGNEELKLDLVTRLPNRHAHSIHMLY